MTGRLSGKVAIITGAASGMGASHAQAFVAEGARLLLTDINVDAGRALAEELGPNAIFHRLDVTSPAEWSAAIAGAEAAFGPVTVLVNNAGVADASRFEDVTEERYRQIIEINQLSIFHAFKAVVPSMRASGGGSIINISSVVGLVGAAVGFPYVATKFAVTGMTKAAAVEFAPMNIRVNSVHPGMINTPMLGAAQLPDAVLASVPMDRIGEPQDVTGIVVTLAADESRYTTGASFVVDGGMTAW